MFSKFAYQTLQATKRDSEALGKIIDNIANIKSIGYKKNTTSFHETLNGEIARQEAKDFSQGPLRRTAEPLDLAIDGKGFFEVELPNGQRAYTRVGRFRLTGDGELVTHSEGYKVVSFVEPTSTVKNTSQNSLDLNMELTTQSLKIPANLTPEITEEGVINGINEVTGEKTKLGRINLVAFNNTQGLKAVGGGFYLSTQLSGEAQETQYGPNHGTRVRQGFLEFSNVNVAQEMSDLSQMKSFISAQFKVLKVIDKLYEQVNYTIGRTA